MNDYDQLIEAAKAARANAYAPYSVYSVGAAVLGEDGVVYSGCNVENVSYGLTICAERVAIACMVLAGCRRVLSVAIVTSDGGTPCGMCLQTLLEFVEDPEAVNIFCVNAATDVIQRFQLRELLPFGFRTSSVGRTS